MTASQVKMETDTSPFMIEKHLFGSVWVHERRDKHKMFTDTR
jgi:hypothetical protein